MDCLLDSSVVSSFGDGDGSLHGMPVSSGRNIASVAKAMVRFSEGNHEKAKHDNKPK